MNLKTVEYQQEETMIHSRKTMFLGALGIAAGVFLSAPAVAADAPNPLCPVCHGDGNNTMLPLYPKLGGLDAAYLTKQIHDFQAGRRTNPVMDEVIKQLPASDIAAVAEYYSQQTRTPDEIADKDLAKQGEQIFQHGIASQAVPACANCHNDDGSGTFRYPRLAGQHSVYLINQLVNLKSGDRANDFGQMSRVARRLTDDQMKAVAEYVSGLK
jgi:cytochrome c553